MFILRILRATLFIVAAAVATASNAATVPAFDTLGPANAYTFGQGFSVGGGSGPYRINYAPLMKFTAGATGTLVSAELALQTYCCAGASPVVTLRLMSDNNGVPGHVLETAGSSVSYAPEVVSGTFAGGLQITSGTTYWFGVTTADANAGHGWGRNVLGFVGTHAFTGAYWQLPGEWFYNNNITLGAFRVSVASPVDEPTVALLFALGAVPLVCCLRTRV